MVPVVGLRLADGMQPEFQPVKVGHRAADQANLTRQIEEPCPGIGLAVIADQGRYKQGARSVPGLPFGEAIHVHCEQPRAITRQMRGVVPHPDDHIEDAEQRDPFRNSGILTQLR